MANLIKNYIEDVGIESEKLYGIYRGVVEDRNDPEQLGRCRVRVFGLHTEKNKKDDNLDGIPTNELPWAEPDCSLFEGSVSEFGLWAVPLQGSHVSVYFENGDHLKPRIFASRPGLPISQNPFDKIGVSYSHPGILAPGSDPSGAGESGSMSDPGQVPNEELGNIIVTLTRTQSDERGTVGVLSTNMGFKCNTLELPWKNNERNNSCVPKGEYILKMTPGTKWNGYYEIISPGNGRAGCRLHPNIWWAGDKTLGYKCEIQGCIGLTEKLNLGIAPGGQRPGKQWCANGSQAIANFMNHTKKQPCKFIINGV